MISDKSAQVQLSCADNRLRPHSSGGEDMVHGIQSSSLDQSIVKLGELLKDMARAQEGLAGKMLKASVTTRVQGAHIQGLGENLNTIA